MNYIKELNAFREWLLLHDLPGSAVALWYTLMSINNMSRWKTRFNAPNGTAQQLSGLSKSGLHGARKLLEEHGLIKYEAGEKGKAPVYEMVSFEKTVEEPIEEPLETPIEQHVDPVENPTKEPSVNPSMNQPRTILKHKLNKVRRGGEGAGGALVNAYEQNIGILSPITRMELRKWLDVFSEDVILEAVTVACKLNRKTFRYLEKILIEWREAEIASIEDVRRHLEAKKTPVDNTVPFRKSAHKRSLFDELREEMTAT